MKQALLFIILSIAICTADDFFVESHDGSAGGYYTEGAKQVFQFYGAVTNLLDSCDVAGIPDFLTPSEYLWQFTDSMDSYAPIGDGPYNDLPIEPYRSSLQYMVEDGSEGPFGMPLGASEVPVEYKEDRIITNSDGSTYQIQIIRPLKSNGRPYPPSKTLPVILYAHGGCFALCPAASTYAGFLTRLAASTQHIVVWVGYRLAPEWRYPAAIDDFFNAGKWIKSNIDQFGGKKNNIAIMGDSAGGMLALLAAKRARDATNNAFPSVKAVIPIYPMIDWTADPSKYKSLHTHGWANTFPLIEYHIFRDMYLGPDATLSLMQNPDVSPIYGDLSNLPPLRIYTAEHDMLRSEGEEFARLALEADNDVSVVRMQGFTHPALANAGNAITGYAELLEWFLEDVQEYL